MLDNRPIPGMMITPAYGVAPLNGLTAIKIEMNPVEIFKFDARVMLQIRGGKMLELRLAGESDEPVFDIDVVIIIEDFTRIILFLLSTFDLNSKQLIFFSFFF